MPLQILGDSSCRVDHDYAQAARCRGYPNVVWEFWQRVIAFFHSEVHPDRTAWWARLGNVIKQKLDCYPDHSKFNSGIFGCQTDL
jgi:hypothetical protein